MPRLNQVTVETATGETRELLEDLEKKMGRVINIFQGMANSPAALRAYLQMSQALSEGELSPADREAIYLAVSEQNGCNYCVSAHTTIASKQGLPEELVLKARQFEADDEQLHTLLQFVREVIARKGFVDEQHVEQVRDAGYSDGQIAEAVAYIGLATYSNLFNHVHDTPLDFPAAEKLSS